MNNNETMIVIANGSVARFFHLEQKGELRELDSEVHPESHLKSGDLLSDRQGRTFSRTGHARHSMEKPTTPRRKEETIFARSVIAHLEKALGDGQLKRFYMAAAPEFLGLLRAEIGNQLAHHLVGELNKDLTHCTIEEIKSYFPNMH